MILSELHFLFVIINIMVISNTTKIVRIVVSRMKKKVTKKEELNRKTKNLKSMKEQEISHSVM